MLVAKWGNSLAVRIPADVARTLELKEGDSVELRAADRGVLELDNVSERRRRAVERIREMAQPFSPKYQFDREEANSRDQGFL
jgi:antitoxin MazE